MVEIELLAWRTVMTIPTGRSCRVGGEQNTYRWDLLGQINRLGDGDLALLDRAIEVDVLHLLAEVGLRVDEADVAVLDLQQHVCAIYDVFFHCSGCFDDESGSAV